MVTEIEDLTANVAMLGQEELDLIRNLDVGSLMVKVDVGMVTHAGLSIYKTSTIAIYLMVIDWCSDLDIYKKLTCSYFHKIPLIVPLRLALFCCGYAYLLIGFVFSSTCLSLTLNWISLFYRNSF